MSRGAGIFYNDAAAGGICLVFKTLIIPRGAADVDRCGFGGVFDRCIVASGEGGPSRRIDGHFLFPRLDLVGFGWTGGEFQALWACSEHQESKFSMVEVIHNLHGSGIFS